MNLEEITETDGNELNLPLDEVLANLQRQLTSTSYKAQQIASYIKQTHPEEKDKYNLAIDIEMELDALRKRVFDAR